MFGFLKKLTVGHDEDLLNALKKGGAIIDVRSAAEFAQGSAQGAINIPHTDIRQASSQIKTLNQPIIVCCASGMRSSAALQELKSMGYTDSVNGKTWSDVSAAQEQL